MNDGGHNSQQHPIRGGSDDVLRQVREKLAEVAALLARLSRPSPDDPLWGAASHGSPVMPAAGAAAPTGVAAVRTPSRLPVLQKHDMQAYQLCHFVGLRQADIARKLNEEHGTTYSQGQVSKMIQRAGVHMKATGLSPAAAPAKPARAVDPSALELGKRTDGRPTDGRRSKRGASDE